MAFFAPYKYKFVKLLNTGGKNILDVGAANGSPEMFFSYFKGYEYDALDIDEECLSEKGKKLINRFYKADLEKDDLSEIPDNHYDYVVLSHVIEHIDNGEKALEKLALKIRNGGLMYAEYPSAKSARLPSMKGTLNFYDDPTHKRFYDLNKLKNVLSGNGFEILKCGVKRDILRIAGIPYMVVKSLIKLGYVRGSAFWDLFGFAEFLLARRVK
ncbi:MAG: class I SAM-dependent methyltransferase [Bacteroidetes bacterium]|nr:class I SAM-dependent methyltransferase [Bacteroidota bacterium]